MVTCYSLHLNIVWIVTSQKEECSRPEGREIRNLFDYPHVRGLRLEAPALSEWIQAFKGLLVGFSGRRLYAYPEEKEWNAVVRVKCGLNKENVHSEKA